MTYEYAEVHLDVWHINEHAADGWRVVPGIVSARQERQGEVATMTVLMEREVKE